MKKFISNLGVMLGSEELIPLYCDNNGTIAQAKKPMSHEKSKHVLRRFHLIREIVTRDVVVERVSMKDNNADPLTKPLSQIIFECYRGLIRIRHIGDRI